MDLTLSTYTSLYLVLLTIIYKLRQKHNKEWRDQIIDPLDVATSWMSDGPDI